MLSALSRKEDDEIFSSNSLNFRTIINSVNSEEVRTQLEGIANDVLLQIPFEENSLYGALVVQAVQIANENNLSIGKVATDFISENVDLLVSLAEDFVAERDGVDLKGCPTFEVSSNA